jgi:hypothetical protein
VRRPYSSVFWVLIVCLVVLTSCQKKDQQQTEQKPAQQEPAARAGEAAQPVPEQSAQPSKSVTAPSEQTPAVGEQLVPLDIKLPKPMFVGTPTNLAVANLEKPLGHPRSPFLALAGTKNVAYKKPVTGSDEQPIIGELPMVVDGDKEAGEGSFVELGPNLQYVTIDLKGQYTLYAIVVWHYHKQAVVYHDVIVQVADDPDFVANVKTVFNNDIDNTSGRGVGKDMSYVETSEGKLIDAKGLRGRYVRLYSRGNTANDLNHYIEVEVYGKAVQ